MSSYHIYVLNYYISVIKINKRIKYSKKILSLMFAALIFIGCSSANSDKNDAPVLRIGTEGTYSPFTYHDTKIKLDGKKSLKYLNGDEL